MKALDFEIMDRLRCRIVPSPPTVPKALPIGRHSLLPFQISLPEAPVWLRENLYPRMIFEILERPVPDLGVELYSEFVEAQAILLARMRPKVRLAAHDAKKERTRRRSLLIEQARANGITETQAIFAFVLAQDPDCVRKGKKSIDPASMMKNHNAMQRRRSALED
jgi:hypothetical protein